NHQPAQVGEQRWRATPNLYTFPIAAGRHQPAVRVKVQGARTRRWVGIRDPDALVVQPLVQSSGLSISQRLGRWLSRIRGWAPGGAGMATDERAMNQRHGHDAIAWIRNQLRE